MSCCLCCKPPIWIEPMKRNSAIIPLRRSQYVVVSGLMHQRFNFKVRASMVDSSSDSSSNFANRIEQAWLISQDINRAYTIYVVERGWVDDGECYEHTSLDNPRLKCKQPTPIACSSCSSNGIVECKWCAGTGFFIIGDNMLCEVPSRNTTCVICVGEGSTQCSNCQGTGFRAKWLGKPPIYKD